VLLRSGSGGGFGVDRILGLLRKSSQEVVRERLEVLVRGTVLDVSLLDCRLTLGLGGAVLC
jgi:hypothetical protein